MKIVYLLLIASVTLVFTSCKKEEKKDTCTDGYLTPGEEDIDCGGPCKPCVEKKLEFVIAKINDDNIQFENRSITVLSDYLLSASNDSISFILNLGSDIMIGGSSIKANMSTASKNGVDYPVLHSGFVAFTDIDEVNHKLTGYFEAKMTRGTIDTLFIRSGQFSNMPYN